MMFAVSIMMLGYTRINGVQAYNSDTREFLEITPAVAKKLINSNQLKGLCYKNSENGIEFLCDMENWNQSNIPVKTACGKFRPLLNDYPGVVINSMYTVVRVLDTDYKGRLYEVVSNKCCRVKLQENDLKELSKITNVAGIWFNDDEIKIADGVLYEDRRKAFKEDAVEVNIVTVDDNKVILEPVEENDVHEPVEANDVHESNETNDLHESNEANDVHEPVEANDVHEPVEANDVHESNEANDVHEPVEANDVHESNEATVTNESDVHEQNDATSVEYNSLDELFSGLEDSETDTCTEEKVDNKKRNKKNRRK